MRVCLYNRFSPRRLTADERLAIASGQSAENAEDTASMTLQVETNTRYCDYNDIATGENDSRTILKEPFTSAHSVFLFDRPVGATLKDLPRGTHVVCTKLARMFRNVDDGRETLSYFAKRGVIVHFSDEGGVALNVTTPKGQLVATLLLAVTEYEAAETADRTSKGMRNRQRNGERMGRVGYEPFPNTPAEQAVADRILAMHDDGLTFSNIATELNDAGVPRRKHGTKWDFAMVRSVVLRRTEA